MKRGKDKPTLVGDVNPSPLGDGAHALSGGSTRREAQLMAQQTRRWNPSDAANAFVRVILSDAGAKLGGLTEQEWARTLNWFDGRCAYTGEALLNDRTQRDHAIAMNRTHCGLHLYGNVLPATTEANSQKAGKHYRDFVEDPDRLAQIEAFVRESAYWDRVSVFGDLQRYCEAQYRVLCQNSALLK